MVNSANSPLAAKWVKLGDKPTYNHEKGVTVKLAVRTCFPRISQLLVHSLAGILPEGGVGFWHCDAYRSEEITNKIFQKYGMKDRIVLAKSYSICSLLARYRLSPAGFCLMILVVSKLVKVHLGL